MQTKWTIQTKLTDAPRTSINALPDPLQASAWIGNNLIIINNSINLLESLETWKELCCLFKNFGILLVKITYLIFNKYKNLAPSKNFRRNYLT